MSYLDIIKKIEQNQRGKESQAVSADEGGPILAVKIVGSVIGEYWLVLCDTEPFDPGDGLPIYKPSEIKALVGKWYSPEELQAIHRAKTLADGKVVR